MKHILIEVVFTSSALLVGFGTAVSTDRWLDMSERAPEDVRQLKLDLLREAGLMELHNKVYSKVGERDWEQRVKPGFLSAITWRTAKESGTWFPSSQDVIKWVREHPSEARSIMESLADAKHTD